MSELTSKERVLHASNWNGDDRTLCGFAIEGECCDDGTYQEPVTIAKPGEYVTCADCKRCIVHCHAGFTDFSYRVRP